jgi:hypothetical protein
VEQEEVLEQVRLLVVQEAQEALLLGMDLQELQEDPAAVADSPVLTERYLFLVSQAVVAEEEVLLEMREVVTETVDTAEEFLDLPYSQQTLDLEAVEDPRQQVREELGETSPLDQILELLDHREEAAVAAVTNHTTLLEREEQAT